MSGVGDFVKQNLTTGRAKDAAKIFFDPNPKTQFNRARKVVTEDMDATFPKPILPEEKPPVAMPDPEELRRAGRRRAAMQSRRGGRQGTILSDGSRESLGG
jgi:hypothetical protein